MKQVIMLLLLLVVPFCASEIFAQSNLEVTIRKIKESKGTIRVGLFTNEEDFLKSASVGKIVKAKEGEVTVVFEGLKPGDYALSVIHDQNDNGELDSNFVGIPTEGFGFGNNAMGAFGPPSFDKAKVIVESKKAEKQSVDLRYF